MSRHLHPENISKLQQVAEKIIWLLQFKISPCPSQFHRTLPDRYQVFSPSSSVPMPKWGWKGGVVVGTPEHEIL